MLSFYERELGFDTLEVNYTYYQLPSQNTSMGMVKKTSDKFEFIVRSHREMTHEIWEDEARKIVKDNSRVFARFKGGLRPIIESGKLGCVLIQFPSFFWRNQDNFNYIKICREQMKGIPLVIEFRNRSWARDSTFRFLEENDLGFCVVDEPLLSRLMPLIPKSTSSIGYLRLHGRNPRWFDASREERYNYLYSKEELSFLLLYVKSISKDRVKTFIFFNNCHGGSAVKNGLMMKRMLGIMDEYTPLQRQILGSLDGY
jgi:uncharacterized protein YecE (DUF72 family)